MFSSLRALVLGFLVLGASGVARANDATLPASTQRYTLRAALDPTHHTVRGHVSISLVNSADVPLTELLFHLYPNAFRDKQSVFMRESDGKLRGDEFRGPGSLEMITLSVDGRDVLVRADKELVRGDFTQLRVKLEQPLAVNGRMQIESDFVTRLPQVFARSGYEGDFYAVAQWFPKLAKLERDGHFEGFAYHALSEFYADFADYTLVMDTPENYVVGASGELSHEHTERGRTVRRYEARHVIDVAWVASPSLRSRVERMGPVEVRFLYPPGYQRVVSEHMDTVRRGLAHFGERFFPYPYGTLTVVLPPRGASGAAGMEYPSLIMTEGEWLPTPFAARFSGAFVTAHELAHEWFYGLLASNEVRYPVLDEGFAEWASLDLVREMFGVDSFSSFAHLDMFETERRAAATAAAPPGLAAYAFTSREYGASVYARAACALESIRRALGRTRFDTAMRKYAQAQRFEHPTPEDLGRGFDEVYGPGFAEHTLLPLVIDGANSDVHIVEARSRAENGLQRTRVIVRRTGAVALPTWVAIYDAQGKELKRTAFPAHTRFSELTFETKEAVARVQLDPDRALLVDDNARDNVVLLHASPPPNLFARLSSAISLLLSWVGP